MPLPYNRDLIPRAKELRQNMTPQERKLWYLFLRKYPAKFQRQKAVGAFIVDFFCEKALLAVELDGSPHFTAHGIASDADRTIILRQCHIDVIRFTNNAVDYHFERVCAAIDEVVQKKLAEIAVIKERYKEDC